MHYRKLTLCSYVVAFACCVQTITFANACDFTYTPTSSGFCDGCKYEAFIFANRNEACARTSVTQGLARPSLIVEYIDSRIIIHAKHGIGGANGNTVAYQPQKNYVGPDEFDTEVTYRQNGQLGRYRTHVLVTVK